MPRIGSWLPGFQASTSNTQRARHNPRDDAGTSAGDGLRRDSIVPVVSPEGKVNLTSGHTVNGEVLTGDLSWQLREGHVIGGLGSDGLHAVFNGNTLGTDRRFNIPYKMGKDHTPSLSNLRGIKRLHAEITPLPVAALRVVSEKIPTYIQETSSGDPRQIRKNSSSELLSGSILTLGNAPHAISFKVINQPPLLSFKRVERRTVNAPVQEPVRNQGNSDAPLYVPRGSRTPEAGSYYREGEYYVMNRGRGNDESTNSRVFGLPYDLQPR